MAIRVTLDRILLERRMSLTDLSEKVGVTLANLVDPENRQSESNPLLDTQRALPRARMPAGRVAGLRAKRR